MIILWFAEKVSKEERLRRVHAVRNVLKTNAHQLRREEMRIAIELSARRRDLPRAHARFLNAAEQHEADKERL